MSTIKTEVFVSLFIPPNFIEKHKVCCDDFHISANEEKTTLNL